jgi:hypothetical protein
MLDWCVHGDIGTLVRVGMNGRERIVGCWEGLLEVVKRDDLRCCFIDWR